ncbi:hypothetical protein D3C75_1008070 [compost metagenome]
MHELDSLIHQFRRNSNAVRQFACLECLESYCRINNFFENLLRMTCSHLFNFSTALFRGHHNYAAGAAVYNDSNVILLNNLTTLFNEQPFHYFAFGSGLMGNQCLAKNLSGIGANLVKRFGNLNPSCFTASACMNLRFDYHHRCAE